MWQCLMDIKFFNLDLFCVKLLRQIWYILLDYHLLWHSHKLSLLSHIVDNTDLLLRWLSNKLPDITQNAIMLMLLLNQRRVHLWLSWFIFGYLGIKIIFHWRTQNIGVLWNNKILFIIFKVWEMSKEWLYVSP
jgi:hypothetical protein